jgi:pyruvate,water dikinase
MVARGALEQESGLSFLTLGELILWGFGLADPLRPRVAGRRSEHEANRRRTPPDFLGAEPGPREWIDRHGGPAVALPAAAGEIRGIGASAGVVRGRVQVIKTLAEAERLRQGDVLVCVATGVGWTPLFGIAAALVTEVGGSLCHAAVVAREYGLPAVVGTHTATRVLTTGQLVEVDGRAGIVRLL